MNKITTNQIKKLRVKTKAGVMDCRRALEATKGNLAKAEKWLLEKGMVKAEKRADREVSHGVIGSYLHHDRSLGSLVALACETDFVARTEEFKDLAHELAMQAVAVRPKTLKEFLKQPWIRDDSKTINDLVKELSAKTGENIVLKGVKVLDLK